MIHSDEWFGVCFCSWSFHLMSMQTVVFEFSVNPGSNQIGKLCACKHGYCWLTTVILVSNVVLFFRRAMRKEEKWLWCQRHRPPLTTPGLDWPFMPGPGVYHMFTDTSVCRHVSVCLLLLEMIACTQHVFNKLIHLQKFLLYLFYSHVLISSVAKEAFV